MAKPKAKTNKNTRWFVIASVILLATLAYFARDFYLDYQDREKFKRLEAAATDINNQFVNEIGLEQEEFIQDCRYPQEKWGQGALSCGTIYKYGYGSTSRDDLRNIFTIRVLRSVNQILQQDDRLVIFSVNDEGDQCALYLFSNVELRCTDTALKPHYPLSSR